MASGGPDAGQITKEVGDSMSTAAVSVSLHPRTTLRFPPRRRALRPLGGRPP
uniref:Uncharacterized protein n=1 Tax=Arundo donax TaxID=35708 RepID=A0A0A9DHT0_ARUDO